MKYLVHPSKIRSGGPPPDGIPPIDEPRFVSVNEANGWIADSELTGRRLTPVSIDVVVWGDWKKRYPDSEVLSRDTGFTRDYGRDPYGNDYTDRGLFFPVENYSDEIHPKTVVFGIEVQGVYKAYRESDLIKRGRIEDAVSGVRVLLERDAAGTVTVTNRDSGRVIVKERDFWFVWYAFYPTTLLYGS